MANKSNKLSDKNYTWYDLGKPEEEGIFYQDFYNEKVMKIMEEKFINKKVSIVRHGETEEIDGEKVLNNNGEEDIEQLAAKILETIGTNKEINIHYSSKTKRIEETLEILEEILKSEGIKINYFDVDDLDSGGKKKNLGIEINSKTGKVGKYISNIGKNKFKKNFKMFIGDLFAKVFLNKKVDKKSFTNIVLGHSTFIPGLKTLKEKDFTEIHIKSDEINHGEGMTFDFQKGKIVQDNKNIIELNLENYKNVIDLLRDDENFEKIIKRFEDKKVDLQYLQNQMNFIFSNDEKLLQKYFILDKVFIKKITDKLKTISDGINFLTNNSDLNKEYDISTLKINIDKILSFTNSDKYIFDHPEKISGFFIIMDNVFSYLLNKFHIDYEGKEYNHDLRILKLKDYGLKYVCGNHLDKDLNKYIEKIITYDIELLPKERADEKTIRFL